MKSETKRQNEILATTIKKALARTIARYEAEKDGLTEDARNEVEAAIERQRAALKALEG